MISTLVNPFLQDFSYRLREWHCLKNKLVDVSIENKCVEVDKFWQQCPIVNHYLHPADTEDWPDPWILINDNVYCQYARALGMVYTLLLLDIQTIDLFDAIDDNNENVCIVSVNNAKYILNWYPNSVLNTKISNFTNIKVIDLTSIKNRIGRE